MGGAVATDAATAGAGRKKHRTTPSSGAKAQQIERGLEIDRVGDSTECDGSDPAETHREADREPGGHADVLRAGTSGSAPS